MKPPAKFQQVYASLNQQQRQAVDTLEGPVMVVAGPGTGKTQVLAARIANILLKTDTNPSSILALTFTESAAKNMRERLINMIGKTGYYVNISTFHAFCKEVIDTHPEFFPIDRNSQSISEIERYDLLETIIMEAPITVLKPINRPFFYLSDILKAISDLKKEGISVAQFKNIIDQADWLTALKPTASQQAVADKKKLKNQELAVIYEQYEQQLRTNLRYDFDDMIALVVKAFSSERELLSEYQENLLYFLVDEYQDTNSAQNQVVDLLASYWHEKANVFVVGDPNQAIYRFQGASLENVLGFVKRYPTAQVITLATGYRCPQQILDAAHQLILNNYASEPDDAALAENLPTGFDMTAALISNSPVKTSLQLFKAPSQTLESVFIAESIATLIKQSVNPSEIAILYRRNSDSVDLATTLTKWGIRYEIDGGDNVLQVEAIQQLLSFLSVIDQLKIASDDGSLFDVMMYDWVGLNQLLVMKAVKAASRAKVSLSELIENGYDFFQKHYPLTDVTALEFSTLLGWLQRLMKWGVTDTSVTFPAWFETVISESGFLPWILVQANKVELLTALNSLFREVKSLSGQNHHFHLHDFLAKINTLEEHGLKITMEDLNIRRDAVRLSTVHKAKGQEWEHVFIAGLNDGKWGNGKKRELIPLPAGILTNSQLSDKDRNEDDRRLFYVAMTRAKQSLTLTCPDTLIVNNHSTDKVASIFLTEIDHLLTPANQKIVDNVLTKADDHLARLLAPPPPAMMRSITEQEFFHHLVDNFSLSVTALNTYLRDPQEFMRNVLLKVPRAKPEPMAFGTAVHSTLEKVFKEYMEEQHQPELASVLTHYEQVLRRELLTSTDFDRRLAYGQEVLTKYLQQLKIDQVEPIYIERFFGTGWSRTMLDDIKLVGRIDRVDWIDKASKTVRVIDYKTGQAKSVNEIEGKTASSGLSARELELPENIRGPYKRQLVFYKLLTELDKTFIPKATEGVFEFVEPNESGKFVSRSFALLDEDVAELKKLIKTVMVEIRELKFISNSE